jgi:hypothetical protein
LIIPKNLDDNNSDEWTREDFGSSLQLCGFQPLAERDRKKLGIVEMVLYNMASFLASFATGFDIRISNLQPQPVQHPHLQSRITSGEYDMHATNSPLYKGIYPHEKDIMNVGNPHLNKLYGLETYHGPTKQRNRSVREQTISKLINTIHFFSSPHRASLNQFAGFQNSRVANNFMQSTTLTTTSGLGSNFTSYTTDPIDSSSMSSLVSENKMQRLKMNANVGTSSSFLESDMNTDEYIFIPEGENPRFLSPQKMSCYESGSLFHYISEIICVADPLSFQ